MLFLICTQNFRGGQESLSWTLNRCAWDVVLSRFERNRPRLTPLQKVEDYSMRKVISYMNEEERRSLLLLADLGLSVFSAGLAVRTVQVLVGLIP